jgi:hypothetical protein
VIPATGGQIAFKDGFLFDDANTLYALSSDLSGAVVLPSSTKRVANCAFSTPNAKITSLKFPGSVSLDLTPGVGAYNLSGLTSFDIDSTSSKYHTGANGILLYTTSVGSASLLIPMGISGISLANPLIFEDTAPHLYLDPLYKHTSIPAITLPATCVNFSANFALKDGLSQITLLNSEKVVGVAKSTLQNLSSTIAIKVPSSLLSQYQADSVWSTVASSLSAI